MTQAERHRFILEELDKAGFVTVSDLAKAMDVTMVTVRKDLKVLEDKGLLYRSHGSATSVSPYVSDRSVQVKKLEQVEEKSKIAEKALAYIEDQEAIIIGSGTTVVALAQAIPRNKPLTVLTAAMNVTLALMDMQDVELVQLGGVVRKSSSSVVGHYAEEMLQSFACSKLFLSVDGISLEHGLTTSNMMEAHLNAQMIQSVQKTIILADSRKFGRKGFGKICELEDIDVIITDSGIPEIYREKLEEKGIELVVV
ncbi:MAG TPA: transcriptional regulator [Algoriphagus sp.]|jgi:DeoR family transcriptional regulator of aga operon|uniref:DeoR/GlpR family DNA-binding transcription regulator n=1 Tax=unclassified Algoriphagus TaxID=2641541 RepID=UPI000C40F97E|nr:MULTISPECIES: DeoR/GlpR family DNA-binding transcription regulator [unclassified Algoriphagus]MAL14409.1 transcriptional regulator [Algoriphagus sp.]MAN87218.1 transcriptional regulator [Algoriphagus sp.]QYH40956.1 DeoR/GlpR transcriptional regulator [Algoriphagus sp. NBT04N3]HAD53103.1 transcriptional regulator [Algoriphagus sp.]HAH38024.1 transcriptional regulator [Algoriphagus sp.]|tara:strand:- start:785 stop:1546 length:762 start_codon:yes stop_codon:yes gene_type:complete